ncbi:MAG: hypothetical protein IJC59_02495 [Lachnospiraceae bacterium]|nr:hypothetical protein [Lachnospiraceae bacterium]
MSVNGITPYSTVAAGGYNSTDKVSAEPEKAVSEKKPAEKTAAEETGVVYEPSKEAVDSTKKTYTPNTDLINKLKADADARTAQLRSLVEKLITGQGNAIGSADDIWSFLRTGNFTVDAATQAQAQADIAEDGYWGVEQTSDRILDFAKALSGGNPDKIEELREAFEKGFKQATDTWGDELPDISQKTYEATMKKFDAWAEEANGVAKAETEAANDVTKVEV